MQQQKLEDCSQMKNQSAVVLQVSGTVIHTVQLEQKQNHIHKKDETKDKYRSYKNNLHCVCISTSVFLIVLAFIMIIYSLASYQSNLIYQLRAKVMRRVYNQQNKGKQLTKSDKFTIKLQINNTFDPIYGYMSNYGLQNTIQVGSKLDFGVTDLIDFQQLSKQLSESIAYEVIEFDNDWSLQIKPGLLEITQLKEQQQMIKYISELKYKQYNNSNPQQDQMYNLGIQLARNPSNKAIQQVEYYLADRKYEIGQIKTQVPICIVTTEYQLLSKNRFRKQYFESIDAINYTNFHIVYVDDYSTDGTVDQVISYFQNSTSRIKNRIQIIHTLQKLGSLANLYFWTKKFCQNNQIVVILDGDDTLIGKQGFKILNSIYQNPNTWYVYSSYLMTTPQKKFIFKGLQSQYLNLKTSQYRKSFKWITSHLRTFRKKLFNSVPFQSLIYYHYNMSSGTAWPVFYSGASDVLMTIALMQLAGNYRIVHIDEFLYNFLSAPNNLTNCYQKHVGYDDAKSRLKTPLKKLRYLGDKGERQQNYNLGSLSFFDLQISYQTYRTNCPEYQINSNSN